MQLHPLHPLKTMRDILARIRNRKSLAVVHIGAREYLLEVRVAMSTVKEVFPEAPDNLVIEKTLEVLKLQGNLHPICLQDGLPNLPMMALLLSLAEQLGEKSGNTA